MNTSICTYGNFYASLHVECSKQNCNRSLRHVPQELWPWHDFLISCWLWIFTYIVSTPCVSVLTALGLNLISVFFFLITTRKDLLNESRRNAQRVGDNIVKWILENLQWLIHALTAHVFNELSWLHDGNALRHIHFTHSKFNHRILRRYSIRPIVPASSHLSNQPYFCRKYICNCHLFQRDKPF